MAVTVQMINDKARLIMQDQGTEGVRWLNSEVIGWVNSGLNEVVMLKPNSLVNNESFLLVTGSSKQVLPSTTGKQALLLLDIPRNLGADGATPGLAIIPIERRVLDLTMRNWHVVDSTQAAVKHFIYDVRDPMHFYIYPPLPSTAYVEIVYTREPNDVTALADTIDLSDIYESCLVDYVLYRAYSKDSDFAGKMDRALTHYKAFLSALGGKEQAESANASSNMFATKPANLPPGAAGQGQ
jgi:hypothetical protein